MTNKFFFRYDVFVALIPTTLWYKFIAQAAGIFGAVDFFTNRSTLPNFKCNNKTVEKIYVSSLDIGPIQLLRACIELLEKMRSSISLPTEKTIIAMPKYRKNVVLLLPDEYLNDVIKNAYDKNLFQWYRRWVMISLDGNLPQLPEGQQVNNANVSVLYVGNNRQTPSVDISNSIEDKLAYDTAYVAKAYIENACGIPLSVTHEGLTGDFNFAEINSPRQTIALTVTRGLLSTPNIVGTITIKDDEYKITGNYNEVFSFEDSAIEDILKSRKIRIAVVLTPPFAMFTDSSKQVTQPTSCDISSLTGMSVDVVQALLKPIGVQYNCTCYNSNMKEEALESVSNGYADMAIGEFAVLPQLRDRFDFISNFLYFTFSVLEAPVTTKGKNFLWLFFTPLSAGCWVMVIVCSIVVALVLATLNYLSPNQAHYGFLESIFVTFGCLFQGLTVSPPNTWSSRFMLCVWWLFVLFFIVIYIANYAAIILNIGFQNEEGGFTALLVDPSIPFGALPTSMAATVLNQSQELEMQKVAYLSNKLYSQADENDITIEQRVQQVREGKYRLISDSFTLEYYATKYCLTVSGEYSSQQYAIILKLNTVYTNYLNERLATLLSEGTIETIIDK
ncbi:hypothetical protein Aperf_G00000035638 [Anoplocephala perfoliata]